MQQVVGGWRRRTGGAAPVNARGARDGPLPAPRLSHAFGQQQNGTLTVLQIITVFHAPEHGAQFVLQAQRANLHIGHGHTALPQGDRVAGAGNVFTDVIHGGSLV